MAQKDINKIMIKIQDEDHFKSLTEASSDKILVVDINQDWCGPCEALFPVLQRLITDYDDDKIIVASASLPKLTQAIQSTLPTDCHIQLHKTGCNPIFAIYRNKICVATLNGVDAPQFISLFASNFPEKGTPLH